jgi:hypothetical protein
MADLRHDCALAAAPAMRDHRHLPKHELLGLAVCAIIEALERYEAETRTPEPGEK